MGSKSPTGGRDALGKGKRLSSGSSGGFKNSGIKRDKKGRFR